MTAVIAHFEIPVAWQNNHAMKKAFIRWSHTCKAYGVRNLCLIDPDSLRPAFGDAEINLAIVQNLQDAIDLFPEHTPVYVEQGGEDLSSFKYYFPENPVFIFGSDFGELPKADVSINTDIPLVAEIACGIILNAWRNG